MAYTTQTIIHIVAGSIGLLSGATALLSKKGGKIHRFSGNVFLIFMLMNSISGAYLAFQAPRMLSVIFGITTFYLTATSWLTVKNIGDLTKLLQFSLCGVALATGVGGIYLGWLAANSTTGTIYGGASNAYCLFSSVALLAAILDVKMFIYGGVFGKQRIIRHLWRMCFALLLATIALFLGQQQLFPSYIREMNILSIPTLAVLVTLIYWALKIKFSKVVTQP